MLIFAGFIIKIMKSWVISENKEIVYKVGEFIIQITTIEYYLERWYEHLTTKTDLHIKFRRMMLGGKIYALKKVLDIENPRLKSLLTKIESVKNFRNKIAHEVLNYNSENHQVYIKSEEITQQLYKELATSDNIISYIVLYCLPNNLKLVSSKIQNLPI